MDFEKEVERFCDGYCKFPLITKTQDVLDAKCESCPIVKIVERLEEYEG